MVAGESSMAPLITFIMLSETCGFLGCAGKCGELSNSVNFPITVVCGEMVDCQYLESWDGEG